MEEQEDNSPFTTPQLTPNAISLLISNHGASPSTVNAPKIVELRPLHISRTNAPSSSRLTVSDGTFHTPVTLLCDRPAIASNSNHSNHNHGYIIRLENWITSQSNLGQSHPRLFVTKYTVLRPLSHKQQQQQQYKTRPYQQTEGKLFGGKVAPFLQHYHLATIDTQTLFGSSDVNGRVTLQLQEIHAFLQKHAAMNTLRNSSNNNNNNASNHPTTVYFETLKQFQHSQLDLQTASLFSNTGGASASVAQQVVTQHRAALQHALNHYETVTVSKLNVTHSMLADGLVTDAGLVRTKNVKVGRTSFGDYTQLSGQLLGLVVQLQELQQRCVEDNSAVSTILFAAVVFLGIVDLHPYSDGNGRLARIFLNWGLKRCGLPFTVPLFCTPAQRILYSEAVKQTRRNIDLVHGGNANTLSSAVRDATLKRAHSLSGAFSPLTTLLVDRIQKSIIEFNKLLQEKSSQHSLELEQKMARQYRMRAAQGSCLICFDDSPNIATLCCGKACHLNCMAEWLSGNNSSCPNCRAALPSIPSRLRSPRRQGDSVASNTEDINDLIVDMEGMEEEYMSSAAEEDDTTTDEVAGQLPANVQQRLQELERLVREMNSSVAHLDENETTEDVSSSEEANETMQDESHSTEEDDSDENDTTEAVDDENENDTTEEVDSDSNDTTEEQQQASDDTTSTDNQNQGPPVLYCFNCNNRAALDCCNHACGRCCLTAGRWDCPRHN